MKRGAEVDLLRNGEDSDMKRLKFDGGEFSGARPDWMKEYGDMFPSEFHQLMEAETVILYNFLLRVFDFIQILHKLISTLYIS